MSQDRYYEALYDPETGGMTLKPKWRDNGPGFARTAGQGGSLVVGVSQGDLDRQNSKRHQQKVYEETRCGFLMPKAGEPCALRKGHKQTHVTRDSIERRQLQRLDRRHAA